jgi:pimeloyl-ACP methyl ester carboxylesterase
MDAATRLASRQRVGTQVAELFSKRMQVANEKFANRVKHAFDDEAASPLAGMASSMDPLAWFSYSVDAAQRSILFWNTLRQRGDNFIDSTSKGLKPVLHFESETVLDGRTFERPVNYALLRITPPEGVTVNARLRPYIIIDPRAGHGPGIGGFKDDSQVGVALRAGHPVYFVIFFRDPEPGQTLLDVCEAEQRFVKTVRELHPSSEKPAIVGNCQGGWAAMMLAASDPDDTGPIVINGAPMSYWGGAWSAGEGDNPMRYAGGMLGGSWLASLTADLGNGKFDGAHLVQNFENLNPANSLWDKYYHLFDKADTEPPRFLEFERWWGGYYLMNREEIEWITRNLFVGNKLWSGDVKNASGKSFDLRDIQSPIVLFASMGDNITPPQQAFNWVADVYGSTEEIKARGQVIVGLLHEDIGHLGIFVSGKVAKKEHSQIVSVLESIEGLPPGLYGMEITEIPGKGGKVEYEVEFHEHRLEDIAARLNRFQRVDEKPFEAVAEVSDFNQRAYELFARPVVQAMSNEPTARMLRAFHPLRVQNWALSQFNPWMSWLAPAAQTVTAHRRALDEKHPLRKAENRHAELFSAMLDHYRAIRDAMTEAGFFSTYATMPAQAVSDRAAAPGAPGADAREMPIVRDALASIGHGGYVEALARVAFLLMRQGEPLPLSRLELRKELLPDYEDYLPGMSPHDWRRVRGEQEIVARYEPDRAIATLPLLLDDPADRERLVSLLEKLTTDRRVLATAPTPVQAAMMERIRKVLGVKSGRKTGVASRKRAVARRA